MALRSASDDVAPASYAGVPTILSSLTSMLPGSDSLQRVPFQSLLAGPIAAGRSLLRVSLLVSCFARQCDIASKWSV